MNTMLTEEQASEFVGVSANTLMRFAEAGYLEVDDISSPTYSKTELCSVFGIPEEREIPESKVVELNFDDGWHDDKEKNLEPASNTVDPEIETSETEIEEITLEPEIETPSQAADTQDLKADKPEPDTTNSTDEAFELSKSKKIIDLQEKILEMKDEEIAELKNKIEWLKERIEKLEEKADRDQLLMLNEMQTVRELLMIQAHQKNKSVLRSALEWIGLIDPEPINLKAPAIELPEGRFKSEVLPEEE